MGMLSKFSIEVNNKMYRVEVPDSVDHNRQSAADKIEKWLSGEKSLQCQIEGEKELIAFGKDLGPISVVRYKVD